MSSLLSNTSRLNSAAPASYSLVAVKTIFWLVGWIAAVASIPLATAAPPTISNVHASASSPGSAVVTWQTTAPSTSQVVFVDSTYVATSASPADPALVTNHQVALQVRPGASYTYYVVSTNQGGSASSANPSGPTAFSTPAVNTSAPLSYRFEAYGPNSVYSGHDLYIGIRSTVLSGPKAHLYFNPTYGLPAGATFHVICSYNATITNEQADSFWDNLGRQWCYGGADASFTARIRTSATTPTGTYSVALHTEANGVQQSAVVSFSVLNPPQNPVRQAATNPAIPGLDLWRQKMTALGQQWCNPSEQMAFGYEPQIWYYDGGRTYFQIADYTNQPGQWEPCALNIVAQYRDYVLTNIGVLPGWRVFPHGLAMNYWRTGDTKSLNAVMALANGSVYSAYQGGVSVNLIRETAYLIETWTLTERLGLPHDPRLDRAIDFGLGHFNQIIAMDGTVLHQPFFDGLMAEALIQYYELSQDARVPAVVKQLLDYLWTKAWNSGSQQMVYNTLEVPVGYTTGLNNLISPAFAWYWALTGDPVYQQRGDQLFSAGINQDISYSGKVYNQNFRWSVDYVRWRQQGIVPSAFLTGSNAAQSVNPQAALLSVGFDAALTGGGSGTGRVWLSKLAAQNTRVALSQTGTSNVLVIPASVTVSAGSEFATFPVRMASVSQVVPVTLVASLNGASVQTSAIVTPAAWGKTDISSVWAPPTVTRGTSSIIVYLTGAAPAGGIPVRLISSNSALVSVPASVLVPAGATQISVPTTVAAVSAPTSVGIQGTVVKTAGVTLQVLPPPPPPPVDISSVLSPATMTRGTSSIIVYLSAAAPAGGITVRMSSSNPVLISVPASVLVPAGASQISVPTTVAAVSAPTSVVIQGTVLKTVGATVQVLPPPPPSAIDISSVWSQPTMTRGTSNVTVYLTAAAPTGGITVKMSSSNPALISVPASVLVPAGASQKAVPTTVGADSAPTSVIIQGTVVKTAKATIQVLPPPVDIYSVWSQPTMTRGTSSVTVFLTAAAPAGGLTVKMSSSNPALISVPASVLVPAGASQKSVTTTVAADSVATSVIIQGTVLKTVKATIQVIPPATNAP